MAALVPAASLSLFVGIALATPPGLLDQAQENITNGVSDHSEFSAQTFTAGREGTLTGVQLHCYPSQHGSYSMSVDILATDGAGAPTGPSLATSDVVVMPSGCDTTEAWIDFTFASPASVSVGTKYAIVWPDALPNSGDWSGAYDATNTIYPDGSMCEVRSSPTWTCLSGPQYWWDLAFRTYVTLTPEGASPTPTTVITAPPTDTLAAPVARTPGSAVGPILLGLVGLAGSLGLAGVAYRRRNRGA